MTGDEGNIVWERRASTETLVLVQADGLARKFMHAETPKETRDSKEELTLRDMETGADPPAIQRQMSNWMAGETKKRRTQHRTSSDSGPSR